MREIQLNLFKPTFIGTNVYVWNRPVFNVDMLHLQRFPTLGLVQTDNRVFRHPVTSDENLKSQGISVN
jgi:hypothetical protein